MNYYIVTGISRGIGYQLVKKLFGPGNFIIGIARHSPEELFSEAEEKGSKFFMFERDLADTPCIEPLVAEIFNLIKVDDADRICLVNNAGIIDPIGPLDQNSVYDINRNAAVNLTAPLALSSLFIFHGKNYFCDKRILNISSGAARNPYFGWSCYCAAKSGIDMFTRCVALEQAEEEFPARIISVAPGIVDTDMQAALRDVPAESFPLKEKFTAYKNEGKLTSPDKTAEKLIELLNADNFPSGEILDIRD